MATAPNNPYYLRRRAIGRAASPPTWACYEEIPYDDDYSSSCSDEDSCSEDDEDYQQPQSQNQRSGRLEHSSDSEDSDSGNAARDRKPNLSRREADDDSDGDANKEGKGKEKEVQKDSKGKQRAIDPEPEQPRGRKHKKKRQPTYTLRPILTIHRSQGFVWNQDLFIPPYAKDRYVASTSPPNARGFLTSNSANTDYEVEVVEIRVKEGEMDDILR